MFKGRIIIVLSGLLLAASVGTTTALITNESYKNFDDMRKEPQVVSPYQEITVVDTPGQKFADAVAAAKFREGWSVDNNNLNSHPSFLPCKPDEHLPTLLTSRRASGGTSEIVVQVYGAGQALEAFNTYSNALARCNSGASNESTEDGLTYIHFTNGSLILAGDSITAVGGATPDEVKKFYAPLIVEQLNATQCASIMTTASDRFRSPFYNPDSYTGYIKNETVKSDESHAVLPNITNFALKPLPALEQLPEQPLPPDFPQLPEITVSKPSLPAKPEPSNIFTEIASFQTVDVVGPGCGWAWTGQVQPTVDKEALKDAETKSLAAALAKANTAANRSFDSQTNWGLSVLALTSHILDYNEYVDKIVEVNAARSSLNKAREELRPSWELYLAALSDWKRQTSESSEALKAWEDEVKQCDDARKALEEWTKEYGYTETPDFEPSEELDIPPKPDGCDEDPIKPTSEDVAKPTPPDTSVTIPNSWLEQERAILNSSVASEE